MFFVRRENGRFTVRDCERTRPMSQAVDDLAYARGLARATETTARVYGQLHWEMQPRREGEPRRPARIGEPAGG